MYLSSELRPVCPREWSHAVESVAAYGPLALFCFFFHALQLHLSHHCGQLHTTIGRSHLYSLFHRLHPYIFIHRLYPAFAFTLCIARFFLDMFVSWLEALVHTALAV